MPPRNVKPDFVDEVRQAMTSLGMTPDDLALQLGYRGRGTTGPWIKNNEWPDDEPIFLKLCEVLKISVTSRHDAEARYTIGWTSVKKPRGMNSMAQNPTFEDQIEQVGKIPEGADGEARLAYELSAFLSVVKTMHDRHFVLFTTQSEIPSPFRQHLRRDLVMALYEAMDQGALVGFVVPSVKRETELRSMYNFQDVSPHGWFKEGFEIFRGNYVIHLNEMGAKKASYDAASRTGFFEWDDFPLTPYGETLTILGETRGHGGTLLRLVRRVPMGTGSGLLLIPTHAGFRDAAIKFIDAILRKEFNTLPESGNSEAAAGRTRFLNHLSRRLAGLVDHTAVI